MGRYHQHKQTKHISMAELDSRLYLRRAVHLRNELDFWSVHGIMNTSGLLQS